MEDYNLEAYVIEYLHMMHGEISRICTELNLNYELTYWDGFFDLEVKIALIDTEIDILKDGLSKYNWKLNTNYHFEDDIYTYYISTADKFFEAKKYFRNKGLSDLI